MKNSINKIEGIGAIISEKEIELGEGVGVDVNEGVEKVPKIKMKPFGSTNSFKYSAEVNDDSVEEMYDVVEVVETTKGAQAKY